MTNHPPEVTSPKDTESPNIQSSEISNILSATYNSPHNAPFQHVHAVPTPNIPIKETKGRVAYLSALRKATGEMQERINEELTLRMGEDRAREEKERGEKGKGVAVDGEGKGKEKGVAGKKGRGKQVVIDEDEAEDNYGEEVVNEDDD